jgi:nitroreductase
MTPISTTTITEALHWRYATKKFDASRKIPASLWAALEESLILAPSSYGLQPWHFVVVQDAGTKEKLSAAAYGQKQPVDCSHLVVFAVRKNFSPADVDHFIDRVAEVRGAPKEGLKGYRDMMVGTVESLAKGGIVDAWSSRQVYIALGEFMTAAALLGVDACPMEGLVPAKFDEILGLSAKGFATLAACAVGYRAPDDPYAHAPKVRFPTSELVTHI